MKIQMLLGPICSGKSTYSNELVKNGTHLRLSIDDIKIMLYRDIPSNKEAEDIVSAIIENCIQLLDGLEKTKDIVLDGFPIDPEQIKYLLSSYDVSITIFKISQFKANLRNRKRYREDGIYIEPSEIRRYNNEFNKFIKSDVFKNITKNISVTYLTNYETKKINFVM